MKYWLFTTNAKGWRILCKKRHVPLREPIKKRIETNDRIIVYVEGKRLGGREVTPPRIRGIFSVIPSESVLSADKTSKGKKIRYFVSIEPSLVLDEDFLAFRELLLDLEFVEKKDQWRRYLQKQMIEIPEQDFIYIKEKITEKMNEE